MRCNKCGGYGEIWIDEVTGSSKLVPCDECPKPDFDEALDEVITELKKMPQEEFRSLVESKKCERCGYPAYDCGCASFKRLDPASLK